MSDSLEENQEVMNQEKSSVSENVQEKLQSSSEGDKNGLNNENYRYENNKCIYTDPVTKNQLEWNEVKNEWVPLTGPQNPPNENYSIEDGTYVFTDTSNNTKYKWDKEKSTWYPLDTTQSKSIEKKEEKKESKVVSSKDKGEEEEEEEDSEEEEDEEGNIKKKEIKRQDMSRGHYGYENDTHIFTDTDGTVYEWDKQKNAWFPRVDEEFLAQYQMSYGFTPPVEETKIEEKKVLVEKKTIEEPETKNKAPQQPTWFEVEPENNTKVYVTNLPLDVTEQEFVDLMQKCGLVMKDIDTGKMKVKLYTEPGTNNLKGDALCTYIKIESVELALKILDGYDFKGKKISVERAKFTMKGSEYNPSLKPKKRKRKEKEKIKKMQAKLFDWHPEKMRGQRSKSDRVVIVKNLFDPSIFDADVGLILEYQQDLREECSKCGDVRKVTIFDKHPEGVAQIIFKEPEAADACLQLLNNRWFGKRQITAETWDGKTKFKIAETDAEIKDRLDKWSTFLVKGEEKEFPPKADEVKRESDQETRSSAGSADETDEDEPAKKKIEHSS